MFQSADLIHTTKLLNLMELSLTLSPVEVALQIEDNLPTAPRMQIGRLLTEYPLSKNKWRLPQNLQRLPELNPCPY